MSCSIFGVDCFVTQRGGVLLFLVRPANVIRTVRVRSSRPRRACRPSTFISRRPSQTLLAREKDPFTINDFLQAHINKLRYDRFDTAVERAFGSLQSATADSWSAAKEEVASSLRGWYRHTHGVDSGANAEEMSAIMEASVLRVTRACFLVRARPAVEASDTRTVFCFTHLSVFFCTRMPSGGRRVHTWSSR